MPPMSSNEPTSSNVPAMLPPISSNKPTPIKFKESVVSSTAVLTFAPWNLGTSWSSLLVWTNNPSVVSGIFTTTLASPLLNLPPSSRN